MTLKENCFETFSYIIHANFYKKT